MGDLHIRLDAQTMILLKRWRQQLAKRTGIRVSLSDAARAALVQGLKKFTLPST
jgi:hypothetical protein